MFQEDNIKYIFLDVWETLLINNIAKNDINLERAKIMFRHTNYLDVNFWKNTIEQEIKKFKLQELRGISITPQQRIENILFQNNIETIKSEQILYEFDKLVIKEYTPMINVKLMKELKEKKCDILLISNTGLTTKHAIIEILSEYNVINKFKDMFFSEDYNVCKPNISFFEIPLNQYKINPNEVIMYGDSKKMDLEPCNKLGIKCIVKNWSLYKNG